MKKATVALPLWSRPASSERTSRYDGQSFTCVALAIL